jgi:RimJ/RimL family protein N-acetyltransferase
MIFETQRLRLRRFTLDDAPFIVQLTNTDGWLRFIGDRNTKTEELAKQYLQNSAFKSYEMYGYGLSMVELKDTHTPLGMCGILHRDTLPHPDIGFALLPDFEGKGYAFEIATGLLQHATNALSINELMAIVVPDNNRSVKLLEKLGMGLVKKFRFEGKDEELLLYKKTLHIATHS